MAETISAIRKRVIVHDEMLVDRAERRETCGTGEEDDVIVID